MVLIVNNCQNVCERQVIFKCFQKPEISRCQYKTLCNDSSILVLFKKVILMWVGVPDLRGTGGKTGLNVENIHFPEFKQKIFPDSP